MNRSTCHRRHCHAMWGVVLTFGTLAVPEMGWGVDHPLGLSAETVANGGVLVIAGGGALPEEIFDEFVKLAGGEDARLVIIPTAHPFDNLGQARRSYSGWYDVGATSVDFLHADNRAECDTEEFVTPLRAATGVWMGGGDQGRLADRYVGTRVEKELKNVLLRGGVVGGTSAGASIMSRRMIRYGSSTHAVTGRGLGLLPLAVIDQHFLARHRQPRLLGVLSNEREMVGLGIDERAALVVQGTRVRVIGSGRVVICRGANADSDPWIRHLDPGDEGDLPDYLPRPGGRTLP